MFWRAVTLAVSPCRAQSTLSQRTRYGAIAIRLSTAPRRQLSLFVPEVSAALIEVIRQHVDPVQSRLIRAHVTLARDEEVEPLSPDLVAERLRQACISPLTLRFGAPKSFEGHGVLLPCTGGAPDFHRLRAHVLGSSSVAEPTAHLTLAHPRNPHAPGNVAASHAALAAPRSITFPTICWIEQEGGEPWVVRRLFRLWPAMPDGATSRSQ